MNKNLVIFVSMLSFTVIGTGLALFYAGKDTNNKTVELSEFSYRKPTMINQSILSNSETKEDNILNDNKSESNSISEDSAVVEESSVIVEDIVSEDRAVVEENSVGVENIVSEDNAVVEENSDTEETVENYDLEEIEELEKPFLSGDLSSDIKPDLSLNNSDQLEDKLKPYGDDNTVKIEDTEGVEVVIKESLDTVTEIFQVPELSNPSVIENKPNIALSEVDKKLDFLEVEKLPVVAEDEAVSGEFTTDSNLNLDEYNGYLIPKRPSYVYIVSPNSNNIENAFMDMNGNYTLITEALFDKWFLKDLNYNVTPYYGNEYKLSQFKGWCETLISVEKEFKKYLIVPNKSDESIPVVEYINQYMYESRILDSNLIVKDDSLSNVNAWIVCLDKKIDNKLPFESDLIFNLVSGIDLGTPSVIKN